MSETIPFEAGAYRYVPGVFQYSAGVAAMPGYHIVRVRFHESLPLAEGFARAESIIRACGRPLTSFCACELRSPAPFDEAGFRSFNEHYVGTLRNWGMLNDGANPVARSNVCPAIDPPQVPSFYAFAFTEPATSSAPSFIVAGSGEAPEGKSSYREHVVRYGDVSPAGLREKARFVLNEMERRLTALGFTWRDTTSVQAYTVYDLHSFFGEEIVRRGAARSGLTWHYNRPPLDSLDYEMDCRGVSLERVSKD